MYVSEVQKQYASWRQRKSFRPGINCKKTKGGRRRADQIKGGSEPTPRIDRIQLVALLQESARVGAGKILELMDKMRLVIVACIQGQRRQAYRHCIPGRDYLDIFKEKDSGKLVLEQTTQKALLLSLIAFVTGSVLAVVYRYAKLTRHLRENGKLLEPTVYELNTEGISATGNGASNGNFRNDLPVKAIRRVVELRDYFILYINKSYTVIPKRFIPADTIGEFRQLVGCRTAVADHRIRNGIAYFLFKT